MKFTLSAVLMALMVVNFETTNAVQLAEEPAVADNAAENESDASDDEEETDAAVLAEDQEIAAMELDAENEADPKKKADKKSKVAAKKASKSKGKKGAKKASKSKGKKGAKKAGKKSKKAKSTITGTAPSGEIAKGYDAPEKMSQPDPKLVKWGTTFYAEKK